MMGLHVPLKVREVIDPFTVRAGKTRMEWLRELVVAGLSDREIAEEMGVEQETVKRYLRELYASRGLSCVSGRRAKLIVQELEARGSNER